MGAYLSEPVTEKFSSDESGTRISYGASSMQGWRMSQEDAHNTILNYDQDTSFFAVYDGHGGAEVAKYCAMKLPDFVKTLTCYRQGRLEEALREGFLQFDASLVSATSLSELKALAGTSSDDSGEVSPEEGEADMLHAEATMPIEDLLARYSGRAKKKEEEGEAGEGSGAAEEKGEEAGAGGSSCPAEKAESSSKEKVVNGECSPEKEEHKADGKAVEAGGSGDSGAGSLAAEASPSGSSAGTAAEGTASGRRPRRAWKPYMALVADHDASSDDSESGEDEEEEEEEDEEEEEEGDEEDEEEEEEVEDDDEEGDCSGWSARLKRRLDQLNTLPTADTETAGYDSGCTAVVSLVRGRQLVVANAGDSRCVVCRSGQALDMSLDHKPEDEAEYSRIRNAGGRVTKEGRVNGGLNLSRAIGDHAYKRNKDLELKDQMITSLPDVKTLEIDPATDEFMVMACDGIWNNMTSQEVVDFVKHELDSGNHQLSAICEKLFDVCLAPDTSGDGTGCDNMTCIIVRFHHDDNKDGAANGSKGVKRPISSVEEEPQEEGAASKKEAAEDAAPPTKRCHVGEAAVADVEATPNGAKATEVTDT